MRLFRFLWSAHKWTGVVLAVVFLNFAATGFLLLMKQRFDWVQPPTRRGAEGALAQVIPMERVLGIALARGIEGLASPDDVDRVDFRPDRRVFKVVSKGYDEVQVDAITGAVLSEDWRPSDLLEDLHDGSFFAAAAHAWLMPLAAVGLFFLVGSGLYLVIAPAVRRRRVALAARRLSRVAAPRSVRVE
jgi:uncharacterized iron-regulated membrane protein